MSEKIKLAVSGYYGCGNAGDEAVLAGIRASFARQAGERAELIALSQNPAETIEQHGIRAVHRMNISSVRQALRESDLLLSGGGSLLQDTTSMRSLLYYLWVARLAFSMNVPVMFYAQGMGPLRRSLSRSLVRLVANHAAAITVRDEASARLLQTIGVRDTPIEVTTDPAFALTPASEEALEHLCRAEKITLEEPYLLAALRPWGSASETLPGNCALLLKELQRQTGMRVLLMPMHRGQDVLFAEQVAERTGCPSAFPVIRHSYSPETLLGLVARSQSVIAMRLHALIFAARVGVPPFALSYDPKVENLMQGLGLGADLEHWDGFDPSEVAGRVTGILSERKARTARLQEQSVERERLALRNADLALTVPGGLFRQGKTETSALPSALD